MGSSFLRGYGDVVKVIFTPHHPTFTVMLQLIPYGDKLKHNSKRRLLQYLDREKMQKWQKIRALNPQLSNSHLKMRVES